MSRLIIALLRGYKRFVSPCLPPACRYYPTCSQYAWEAVENHGVIHGLGLAIARLVRCTPWNRNGIDLVPPSSKGASA